jgi:hypothetical protein
VINGDTEFEKNWAWQSGGNEWQKIIDNEWQLFSGTSLEQENEDSSATREGSGTMTKQGKSYTITTNQSDTTDYDFTYNGLVKNNQDGEKEWKYSGEVHDKAAGNYTLIVPLRETTYERTITGGSVSGTVKEELLKGNSYDIDITNTLAENDTAWGITAGTKKYGNTVTSKESYEGAGNYSYMTSDSVQLFGNVEESGEYSITTNGVQQTLTYNTVTKEWDESNAGTIIYQDKVKFKDTGGGSFDNGKGVINERTANYEGEYTETVYLDDDKIDYHWFYHTSEKYDAAKTDDHFGSIDGNYLLADQYTYDFQTAIDWDTDLAGWLGDYESSRN